jgi:hypothetical protein
MRTLCFTGMDRAEEARLKVLFSDANEWLGGEWMLMPEAQAEVLIVDLESMYGHMTWLKVHKSGKHVIAISTRPDSEAEHVLLRPVTVETLVAALSQASGESAPIAARVSRTHVAFPPPAQAAPTAEIPPPAKPAPPPAAPPAAAKPAPPPPPPSQHAAPPPKPREPVMWDYLRPGGLSGPSRLQIEGAPPLVIDPRTDTYVGGSALKPFIPYCQMSTISADRWQTLTGADLNTHLTPPNEAHPMSRLRWLHALVQGRGELGPGYDPNDKYKLTRWAKTEREFPRHFRIASTMMQAPATPAQIAAASDTAIAEVNDFLNAALDSGLAEPFVEPPSAPDSGGKSGGLLGRLRGSRGG